MSPDLIALDEELIACWQTAALKLGIRLVAPYEIQDTNGLPLRVEGFLPDFGGKNGMILFRVDRPWPKTNLYQSAISDTYRAFSEEVFIEALADWGYYGPASERPEWLPTNGS